MNRGIWSAIGAYIIWGLFPVYWKWLSDVPALQLLGHRVVWSFLALMVVLLATQRLPGMQTALRSRNTLRVYFFAAIAIGVNWLTYVWAVNAGFILEASLGYYINPLLSVLLGVVFLGERLRPGQWVSIGLAAAAVVFLTIAHGSLPWIALTLATSFGLYGLIKKIAPLGSLRGLTLETGLLFLPAVGYLLFCEAAGTGAFFHIGWLGTALLIGAGMVTSVPLLLFSSAAQRIPLSLIGVLQYISPTLQFLLGVFVFHEPFTHIRWIGFGVVWIALILFGLEGARHQVVQPVVAEAG